MACAPISYRVLSNFYIFTQYLRPHSQRTQPALGALDAFGFALWALGFGIEVTADRQKSAWRELPTSKGRFIDVGLWSWSRHPNYVGMCAQVSRLYVVFLGGMRQRITSANVNCIETELE